MSGNRKTRSVSLAPTPAGADAHSHGTRSHAHPLPQQGIQHRHGNGAIGKAITNSDKPSEPQVDIRAMQRKLTSFGFYSGPINGLADEATRAALRAFMNR